ncbi:MAG: DinB family protein [Chloroflexi bacterium]|nr:MAG: ABC transporter [Phototrophicales bacterium]RMF79945.1 MAG: DinB family protein [Chloroflexota bacterium]
MADDPQKALREHVINLLDGRSAHLTFDQAVADFPTEHINTKPPNVPYSFWHLLEHLRIAQWDILEYVRNPQHKSPEWPKGYWPAPDIEADEIVWKATIESFKRDLRDMKAIVANVENDLMQPIPHGYGGHTILREAHLLADHNAYHIGELGILRQVVDAWPNDR